MNGYMFTNHEGFGERDIILKEILYFKLLVPNSAALARTFFSKPKYVRHPAESKKQDSCHQTALFIS